jgi:hypothetical protein
MDDPRKRLRGRGRRRTSGESGKNRCGILAVGARLRGRASERRSEKERRGGGRQEIRDGARRACVLVLRNEGRVRGMIGREELRPLREDLQAIDVPEGPAQR